MSEALREAGWPRVRTGLEDSPPPHVLLANREPAQDNQHKEKNPNKKPLPAQALGTGEKPAAEPAPSDEVAALRKRLAELENSSAARLPAESPQIAAQRPAEKEQAAARIGSLSAEVEKLKAQINKAQASAPNDPLKAWADEKTALQAELTKARQTAAQLTAENAKLKARLEGAKQEQPAAPAPHDQALALAREKAALQAELNKLMSLHRTERQQAADRIGRLSAELEKLQAQVAKPHVSVPDAKLAAQEGNNAAVHPSAEYARLRQGLQAIRELLINKNQRPTQETLQLLEEHTLKLTGSGDSDPAPERLRAENEKAAAQIASLSAEIAKLKAQSAETLAKEKTALRAELLRAAESAKSALALRKSDNEQASYRIAHLLSRLGQLTQQSETAAKEIAASKALANKSAALTAENNRLQEELKKLRQMPSAEDWKKKAESLAAQKDQTAANLQKALASMDQMNGELQKAALALAEKEKTLAAQKREIDEMANSLKYHVANQLKADKARLEAELKAARETAEKQKAALSRLDALEKEKKSLSDENNQLRQARAKAESELKALIDRTAAAASQMPAARALQKDLETLTRESSRQLSEAKASLETLRQQLKEAQTQHKSSLEEAARLGKTVNSQKAENDQLKAALGHLKKELETLTKQLSDLKISRDAAAMQSREEKARSGQMASQAAKNAAQLKAGQTIKEENDKLSAEIIAIRATLGGDLRRAQEKLTEARKTELALNDKIKKLGEDIISFSTEIAKHKEQSAAAAASVKQLNAALETEKKSAAALAEQMAASLQEKEQTIKALNGALAKATESEKSALRNYATLQEAHKASAAQLVELGTTKKLHELAAAEAAQLRKRCDSLDQEVSRLQKIAEAARDTLSRIDPIFLEAKNPPFDAESMERAARQMRQVSAVFPTARFRIAVIAGAAAVAAVNPQSIGQSVLDCLSGKGIDQSRVEAVAPSQPRPSVENPAGDREKCRVEIEAITD